MFLGIGRLIPRFVGLPGDYNGFVYGSLGDTKGLKPRPGTDGWYWLFWDRDRVRHRIAVKLSFAHAEGRNYRQLPARARLREEPAPAEII
jgi:hypothetical protein